MMSTRLKGVLSYSCLLEKLQNSFGSHSLARCTASLTHVANLSSWAISA